LRDRFPRSKERQMITRLDVDYAAEATLTDVPG
jgi:hypothetical protein